MHNATTGDEGHKDTNMSTKPKDPVKHTRVVSLYREQLARECYSTVL